MKKSLILTATFCLLYNITKAQEVWTWAKDGGGNLSDVANEVATDLSGNIYITGNFISDTIVIGIDTLISNGDYDIFLAKYDTDGNVLWARSFGGSYADNGSSILPDTSGNVYVTGYFNDTIFFAADTLISTGNTDAFLVKYDANGNPLWGVKGGGAKEERSWAVSIDGPGNVYITGKFFSSTSTFETDVITNTDGSGNTDDIFVVKYDPAGNVIWAKGAGGSSFDRSFDIAADVFGSVYVTGWFFSTTITFGSSTLNNNGFFDLFILKYDSAGNEIWAKNAGGSLEDEGFGITTDPLGNIYVTGNFHSSAITFDTITLTNNSGDRDMLIVKYDSSGSVVWAKSAGGALQDRGENLAVDMSGNVVVAGWFYSTDMVLASDTLFNYSDRDMFIIKYDPDGNIIWSKSAGGSLADLSNSVAVDTSGNIYAGGYYNSDTMTFGINIITNNSGDNDFFLVKIAECPNIILLTDTSICSGDSISIYGIFRSVAATYYDSSVTTNGCDSVHSTVLTLVNSTYSTNTPDKSICSGDSVTIFSIYRSVSGTYYDSLTTVNGCDSVIITTLTVYVCTGVENFDFINSFKIYPNPNTGEFIIEMNVLKVQDVEIKLFNIMGQVIYSENLKQFKGAYFKQINMKELSKGIYQLQIRTGYGEVNKKIVFE